MMILKRSEPNWFGGILIVVLLTSACTLSQTKSGPVDPGVRSGPPAFRPATLAAGVDHATQASGYTTPLALLAGRSVVGGANRPEQFDYRLPQDAIQRLPSVGNHESEPQHLVLTELLRAKRVNPVDPCKSVVAFAFLET